MLEFIAENGGLRPDPELTAIFGGKNPFSPRAGRLIRKGGMSLDGAREAVTQEGYIFDPGAESGAGPLQSGVNEFLDLISQEAGGTKQYRLGADVSSREEIMAVRQAERDVRASLKAKGIDPKGIRRDVMDKAASLLASGEVRDPETAYEQAIVNHRESFEREGDARLRDTGPIDNWDNWEPAYAHDVLNDARGTSASGNAPAGNEGGAATARQGVGGTGRGLPGSGQNDRTFGRQGDASASLTPNFDKAARDRLAAANEATKARATTFDKGPIGKVLAPGQTASTFKLQDSLVPGRIFKPGPTGGETVQAFRKATGGSQASESALQNAAADSLRAKAFVDGAIDPAKFEAWHAQHAQALAAMDPAFVKQLSDAASATDAMARIAAARKNALVAYQKGALGKLIGVNDPTTIQRVVGSIFGDKDAVRQMRRLAAEARLDKTGAATLGLRRAIVDHIETNFLKDIAKGSEKDAALKANAFQAFVRKKDAVLGQVFSKEEMNNFRAISQDLARQNQSVVNKVPGPGTAQDILPHLKHAAEAGHDNTLLGNLWKSALVGKELVEPIAEHLTGAGSLAVPAIAIGAIGKKVIQGMRDAGMRKVADLVKEGVLDPQIGRALIMKASKRADRGSQITLANQLRRLSAFNSATSAAPGAP